MSQRPDFRTTTAAQGRRAHLLRAAAALLWLSVAAPAPAVRGDADCNGKIAAADLSAVATTLFEGGACVDADANGDGTRSASDVIADLQLLSGANQTALQKIIDQIQPDGTITLGTARQLFQLVYGGLDGVDVPSGPVGGNGDGTIALEAMLRHIDDLSGSDLDRLNEVLDIDGRTGQTIQPGSAMLAAPSARIHAAAAPVNGPFGQPLSIDNEAVQDFIQRVDFWLPKMEAFAQLPFALPIDIDVYATVVPGATADGMTLDADGGGGVPARCRLRFFQAAIDTTFDQNGRERDGIVTRELWHCFEAVIVGDRDTVDREPKWITDGQAEYVAAFLSRPGSVPFGDYLVRPAVPLFARAAEAIGFYVTMEGDGTAMSSALRSMLLTGSGSSGLAFDAALSATPRLLDTWGENEFLDEIDGRDWNYSVSTGFPAGVAGQMFPGTVNLEMGDGSVELVQLPAHSVFLWTVGITTDLVHFQIQGRARGIGALGDEYNDLTDTWLCRHDDPQNCKCPEGSEGEAPESQLVSASMKMAASAGDEGVYGTITSISLDQFCKQKQPPPPPSKFCEDARNLQAAINQFDLGNLDPTVLQTELEVDVHWLGLMAQDAPADIVGAMQPLSAAYVTANTDFASIGYRALPMSEQDAMEEQAALKAITAVAPQAQAVGAYVARVCGFQFSLNGV
jgi:hypothetical protein